MAKQRIGIYAGTFDPVHTGHITFALQAARWGKLDKLYFLPERRPRHKKGVEHFGHRAAMLERAITPHPAFAILDDMEDVNFSVERTLPRLRRRFPNDQLVFLFGSDVARQLSSWPLAERLISGHELIVGLRGQTKRTQLEQIITAWPTQPKALTIIDSYAPTVSSSRVRHGLQQQQPVDGLLTSVERYSGQNWLYVSLSQPPVTR